MESFPLNDSGNVRKSGGGDDSRRALYHADNVVRVTTHSKGTLTLKGKNVILATGSSPVIPDIPELISAAGYDKP